MRYRSSAFALAVLGLVSFAAARSQAAPPPALTVHIADFRFVPGMRSVPAGGSVRFVNDDEEAHTVTAVDKHFDSGGLDAHDAWTHRFMQPGTYRYFCELHPMMTGTIVVGPAVPK